MYVLGTDTLGRDMLSRLSLAGRVSLFIGFSAVVISLFIGVTLGLIAGFFRGWVENVIMGIADLQLSIPRVLLLIAVAAILGTGVFKLAILLGITSWVAYGRVARAMALSLREREFVLSATTQGASAFWNIRKHLLPNVLPQMLIVGSYELGQIIVLESALSYLGLGVQPPLPSWGLMVERGADLSRARSLAVGAAEHRAVHAGRGRPDLLAVVHGRKRHVGRDCEGAVTMASMSGRAHESRNAGEPILSARNLVIEVPVRIRNDASGRRRVVRRLSA